MKQVEKPKVLDKEVMEEAAKVKGLYYTGGIEYLERLISFGIKRCEAQLDADAAYYEPIIQQARQEGQDVVLILLANDYPDEAVSLRQSLKSKFQEGK